MKFTLTQLQQHFIGNISYYILVEKQGWIGKATVKVEQLTKNKGSIHYYILSLSCFPPFGHHTTLFILFIGTTLGREDTPKLILFQVNHYVGLLKEKGPFWKCCQLLWRQPFTVFHMQPINAGERSGCTFRMHLELMKHENIVQIKLQGTARTKQEILGVVTLPLCYSKSKMNKVCRSVLLGSCNS